MNHACQDCLDKENEELIFPSVHIDFFLDNLGYLGPVNLWRFGLRPKPRNLLTRIVTLKDLPPFRALKEYAVTQLAGVATRSPGVVLAPPTKD